METVCSVSLVLCDLFSKIISCRVKYFSSFFLNFHVYISLYLVSFSPQPSSHPSLAGLHLSPKKAPFHFYIKYLLFLSLPPFSSLNFAYTHMHALTHTSRFCVYKLKHCIFASESHLTVISSSIHPFRCKCHDFVCLLLFFMSE